MQQFFAIWALHNFRNVIHIPGSVLFGSSSANIKELKRTRPKVLLARTIPSKISIPRLAPLQSVSPSNTNTRSDSFEFEYADFSCSSRFRARVSRFDHSERCAKGWRRDETLVQWRLSSAIRWRVYPIPVVDGLCLLVYSSPRWIFLFYYYLILLIERSSQTLQPATRRSDRNRASSGT